MKTKLSFVLSALATVILAGCSASPTQIGNIYDIDANKNGTEDVYEQSGMEVSLVAAQMAKTIYDTMYLNLEPLNVGKTTNNTSSVTSNTNANGENVKIVAFPKIAITSFVDTDTYENSGYLGRTLAEIFVHEFNRRKVPVLEYKMTGNITVSDDGEYIFTRDWRKLARQALVSHVLAGTVSRNLRGVVLSARVINMQDNKVLGSATGFIPYELLPYCYRTLEKNCTLTAHDAYKTPTELMREQERQNQIMQSQKKVLGRGGVTLDNVKVGYNPNTNTYITANGLIVPATMPGNYYKDITSTTNVNAADATNNNGAATSTQTSASSNTTSRSSSLFGNSDGKCTGINCTNTIIYPASSYEHNNLMIRDIGSQSQYDRLNK